MRCQFHQECCLSHHLVRLARCILDSCFKAIVEYTLLVVLSCFFPSVKKSVVGDTFVRLYFLFARCRWKRVSGRGIGLFSLVVFGGVFSGRGFGSTPIGDLIYVYVKYYMEYRIASRFFVKTVEISKLEQFNLIKQHLRLNFPSL